MSTHFILKISFINIFSLLLFLFSKLAEWEEYLCGIILVSKKIMGILPKVYKCICGYFLSPTPLGYAQLFFAKSSSISDLFDYVTKPYTKIIYLDLHFYHLSKIILE
jgi:hypothetical protein